MPIAKFIPEFLSFKFKFGCRPNLLLKSLPLVLLFLIASTSRAQRPESAAALQRQSVLAPASFSQSAAAELSSTTGEPIIAGPFGAAPSAAADLHAGMHAIPVDEFARITRARIQNFLLGLPGALNLMAVDAAGNRDGRVDVGDVVAFVRKQLP